MTWTAKPAALATFLLLSGAGSVAAAGICTGYGPQTPRDISSATGSNPVAFKFAPASADMNLCNIHFHTQAEHKGPGFSIFAGASKHGGYQCNGSGDLTSAELAAASAGASACGDVKPGDTVEVHWVYSSCDVSPGEGLGACVSDSCANPQLRVESQVFLVVNDTSAADFADFDYAGEPQSGVHQPKALPTGTGSPVLFTGSTTGPKYTEEKCSPFQVTWNVRPACAKLDINSLNAWCASNAFNEDHAHGVRQLVTSAELLSTIK